MPQPPVSPDQLKDACLLLVDDEQTNLTLLRLILGRAGYTRVHTLSDARDVLPLARALNPDLVVLDLRMPTMSGFTVLEGLVEQTAPDEFLPILVVTGDASQTARQRALKLGAKDFLTKPFEATEVLLRIHNLLVTRMLHESLRSQNELLEAKVKERTKQLERAVVQAEEANRAKSVFLATMSHELLTPLNAVIGFANELQKNHARNLLPQDLAYLQRISTNGLHLLRVINDVLDLSRVEAGKMDVDLAPVALDRVVAAVLKEMESRSVGTAVVPRVSLPPSLEPIEADEAKLRRVLINLVDNAVKFTDSGSYRVGIITESGTGRPLRLDVVDTGIGIAPDRVEKIFGAFEQVESGTRRRHEGTGLGLAIARALCEAMGYRLTAVSEPGRGSAFSVLFSPDAAPPRSYDDALRAYTPSSSEVPTRGT
ncbi:MAG: response regulator [Gemmatimonadota bacterium]|nr:response regulator [Gemmatimonadota bacterium]MDE3215664.1 response regulator [Gemmatimonadota bacterium]